MSELLPTKQAISHLDSMVSLANTLITESMNQTDPISAPNRTISKDEFLQQYSAHSEELCSILDNLTTTDSEPVDAELEQSRAELKALVDHLNGKLQKLEHIRFWMDNMLFAQNNSSQK